MKIGIILVLIIASVAGADANAQTRSEAAVIVQEISESYAVKRMVENTVNEKGVAEKWVDLNIRQVCYLIGKDGATMKCFSIEDVNLLKSSLKVPVKVFRVTGSRLEERLLDGYTVNLWGMAEKWIDSSLRIVCYVAGYGKPYSMNCSKF